MSADLAWFDTSSGQSFPETGVNVMGTVLADGTGGGTMSLFIQASVNTSTESFLDTSATQSGQAPLFDDQSQSLSAGSSTQYGPNNIVLDTFQWSAQMPAYTPPVITVAPKAVR